MTKQIQMEKVPLVIFYLEDNQIKYTLMPDAIQVFDRLAAHLELLSNEMMDELYMAKKKQ